MNNVHPNAIQVAKRAENLRLAKFAVEAIDRADLLPLLTHINRVFGVVTVDHCLRTLKEAGL